MSVLARGTPPPDAPGPAGKSLRAQGVGRRFVDKRRGTVTALEEVDLEIAPGEFVCLLGPSGCGKSTLLSILGGLDRPTAGQVFLGERAIEEPLLNMGFAFQRDLLLDWRTALDNVLLPFELRGAGVRERRQQAMDLLELAGLKDFSHAMPSSLSGGMRQRVALCRTLVSDPDVLLMDEPFAALDAFSRERMNEELLRLFLLRQDRIGLFVTHSIDEAVFLGTRILVMSPRPGRIVADHRVRIPLERTKETRTSDAFLAEVKMVREIFMEHGDQDWSMP